MDESYSNVRILFALRLAKVIVFSLAELMSRDTLRQPSVALFVDYKV